MQSDFPDNSSTHLAPYTVVINFLIHISWCSSKIENFPPMIFWILYSLYNWFLIFPSFVFTSSSFTHPFNSIYTMLPTFQVLLRRHMGNINEQDRQTMLLFQSTVLYHYHHFCILLIKPYQFTLGVSSK